MLKKMILYSYIITWVASITIIFIALFSPASKQIDFNFLDETHYFSSKEKKIITSKLESHIHVYQKDIQTTDINGFNEREFALTPPLLVNLNVEDIRPRSPKMVEY